jgi:hypothetical protein
MEPTHRFSPRVGLAMITEIASIKLKNVLILLGSIELMAK